MFFRSLSLKKSPTKCHQLLCYKQWCEIFIQVCVLCSMQPSRHMTLNWCCLNVDSMQPTLKQRWFNIMWLLGNLIQIGNNLTPTICVCLICDFILKIKISSNYYFCWSHFNESKGTRFRVLLSTKLITYACYNSYTNKSQVRQ